MYQPLHFYLVFNPMLNTDSDYASQAHEFYQQLKHKVQGGEVEKAFMYWGKIKVNQGAESQFEQIKQIYQQNLEHGEDTHLYITDFHHFWVAKIEGVQKEVLNQEHTLPFYDNKEVDLWFKITDMDLLSAEFEESSCYLKQLFIDNDYSDQVVESLTPYVGGLKFPVVVEDRSLEKYFKNIYSEDGHRVNRRNALIEHPTFSGNITTQMKSFVLPPHIFSRLSNLVRSEILAVETRLAKKEGPNSNFVFDTVNCYLRILESLMNDTLGKVLKYNFGETLYISNCGSKFYDHKNDQNVEINNFHQNITMGAFCSLLRDISEFGNLSLHQLEQSHPELVRYFIDQLEPFLTQYEIPSKRIQLQETGEIQVRTQEAFAIRNQILGVGCEGVIIQLIKLTALNDPEENYNMIA